MKFSQDCVFVCFLCGGCVCVCVRPSNWGSTVSVHRSGLGGSDTHTNTWPNLLLQNTWKFTPATAYTHTHTHTHTNILTGRAHLVSEMALMNANLLAAGAGGRHKLDETETCRVNQLYRQNVICFSGCTKNKWALLITNTVPEPMNSNMSPFWK